LFSPLCFDYAGGLRIEFHIILDILKYQEKCHTDWSSILHQIMLGLSLGRTHSQQEVSGIEGQYLLSDLIGLWAIKQAGQCLEVAVELLYSDKKLTYQDPDGFLQCVGDIILEGLAHIMMKHL
jgi:hypothetical protein